MKTMITLKADTAIKRQAQEIAENMGLTLSSLLNAFLHQFVAKRSFEISDELEPSPYLKKIIKQAEKDIKNHKNLSPVFKTADEAVAYLKGICK